MSENEIYKAALNKLGATKQIFKTFEEMAELQVAISQNQTKGIGNYNEIAEEIADVRIMLEQMLILFDCRGLSDRYKREKIARLERMIER